MKKLVFFVFLLCVLYSIPFKNNRLINYYVKEYILNSKLPENYINQYLKIALEVEEQTGVPIEIQMTIDIIETGFKKENMKYNNGGNVTCKCNYSKNKHTDDSVCFVGFDNIEKQYVRYVKENSIEEAWLKKAKIIKGYKWYKEDMDFDYYANHLQGTYASSSTYAKALKYLKRKYFKNVEYGYIYYT